MLSLLLQITLVCLASRVDRNRPARIAARPRPQFPLPGWPGRLYCQSAGRNERMYCRAGARCAPTRNSFLAAWEQVQHFVNSAPPLAPLCVVCEVRAFCPRCPAWSELETGALKPGKSRYAFFKTRQAAVDRLAQQIRQRQLRVLATTGIG